MTATLTAYLQQLRGVTCSAVVGYHHRPLYQNRQNPYRGKLCLGNYKKVKVLRMGWPIVENVPTHCGIIPQTDSSVGVLAG